MDAGRVSLEQIGVPPAAIEHLKRADSPDLDHALTWLDRPGQGLLLQQDPRYPSRLRELSDAPLGLFWRGDTDLLTTAQLAIVGSRNPTPAGARHARGFAAELSRRGLVITSGLALGVDAAAHCGALDARGLTVAVTGTGLDICYPSSHAALAERIAAEGLLLSEFTPGTPARRANFPRRNRLIAGLSLGTLVVEAALRSGSLITARLAAEQGREVFAIPGSVDNPLARGCHRLIRQGAKLVESADDILEELAPMVDNVDVTPASAAVATPAVHDEDYQLLLTHLDNAPMSIDALVEATGLSVSSVSSMLLILELQGAVVMAPGGGYQASARPDAS